MLDMKCKNIIWTALFQQRFRPASAEIRKTASESAWIAKASACMSRMRAVEMERSGSLGQSDNPDGKRFGEREREEKRVRSPLCSCARIRVIRIFNRKCAG
jgi:hypothetical protein